MSVGLVELLAEEDGLVGGELPGDFVGLTDLTGFGLPLGFGTGTEALAVWLGVGVSVLDEGWLACWATAGPRKANRPRTKANRPP